MDAPNPDSGEEWYHTEHPKCSGRWMKGNPLCWWRQHGSAVECPAPGAKPDGWFRHQTASRSSPGKGRQPTLRRYAQIMQAYTPEQVPVLSGLAREFGCSITGSARSHHGTVHEPVVLDRRHLHTAATTGGTINAPMSHWIGTTLPRRSSAASGSRKDVEGLSPRNRARQHCGLIHPQLRQVRNQLHCRSSSSKSMPQTGRCRTSL